MKIIQNNFYLIILLLCLSSCQGLDIDPEDDVTIDKLFQSPQDAEGALLGLYASLQDKHYYGGYYVLMADALGGDAKTGGYNNSTLFELSSNTVTPENIIIENLWNSIYKTITTSNYLIEGLNKISDGAFQFKRGKQIQGQARALRAMAHFDCLRYFGEHWDTLSRNGIPIVDRIKPYIEVTPRNSVKENYDFIVSELETAITLMNTDEKKTQYMTILGAKALLARVNLYKQDYNKAENYATQVIDSKQFRLLTKENYPSVFSSRQTSESIFELAFSKNEQSAFNSLSFFNEKAIRSDVYFLTGENLKNFWQNRDGDVRGKLLTFDSKMNNESILPDGRSLKYRGEVNQDNPAYIIRYAEMFLIRAECNPPKKGIEDLNFLRATRGLARVPTIFGISNIDFEKTLVDERRAELFFEGHRYFDLARWHKINEVLGVPNFRACLPIPDREIKVSKNVITQNPGY
jgi:starch-binding outer membrane protein, SusD/RagB family